MVLAVHAHEGLLHPMLVGLHPSHSCPTVTAAPQPQLPHSHSCPTAQLPHSHSCPTVTAATQPQLPHTATTQSQLPHPGRELQPSLHTAVPALHKSSVHNNRSLLFLLSIIIEVFCSCSP